MNNDPLLTRMTSTFARSVLTAICVELARRRFRSSRRLPEPQKRSALVLPELKGKLDGISLRVPTPNVSIVDFVAEIGRNTTREEVNAAMKKAAAGPLRGILQYSEEPLVSVDFRGNSHSSILDAPYTSVLEGNMVKLLSWYDNEWGYSCRVVDLVKYIAEQGL